MLIFPNGKPDEEYDQKGNNKKRVSGSGMPWPSGRPFQHYGVRASGQRMKCNAKEMAQDWKAHEISALTGTGNFSSDRCKPML